MFQLGSLVLLGPIQNKRRKNALSTSSGNVVSVLYRWLNFVFWSFGFTGPGAPEGEAEWDWAGEVGVDGLWRLCDMSAQRCVDGLKYSPDRKYIFAM